MRAYRGGYLPNERREIEQDLFAGRLRAVAATNALELGIDIGSLDVAVLVNYPGTIASCWQQAGRSGRRHDESLAVLLAGNDPVDQYLLRHPEYFFAQSPEHAVVDPDNPYVLAKHLKAAAFELPLADDDLAAFGPLAGPIVEALCQEEQLVEVKGAYYHPGGQNPAVGVSLRHMSDNTFSIVLVETRSGECGMGERARPQPPALPIPPSSPTSTRSARRSSSTPRPSTCTTARRISCASSISLGKVAYVERRETDYYTQAVLESNVRITGERATSDALPAALLAYGDVDVTWQTVAFKKIKFATRENIGLGPVDIPGPAAPDDGVLAGAGRRRARGS